MSEKVLVLNENVHINSKQFCTVINRYILMVDSFFSTVSYRTNHDLMFQYIVAFFGNIHTAYSILSEWIFSELWICILFILSRNNRKMNCKCKCVAHYLYRNTMLINILTKWTKRYICLTYFNQTGSKHYGVEVYYRHMYVVTLKNFFYIENMLLFRRNVSNGLAWRLRMEYLPPIPEHLKIRTLFLGPFTFLYFFTLKTSYLTGSATQEFLFFPCDTHLFNRKEAYFTELNK